MVASSENKVWVIVPAAGSGQRMASNTPKQYLKLNTMTMLEVSLQVLLENSNITQVVVCTAPEDEVWATLAVAQHKKVSSAVGGHSRAQSVMNGLSRISEQAGADDWVMVHDAARPCLTTQLLAQMIDELKTDPVGGILAVPARDTLKLSSDNGHSIEHTLDRLRVWLAQTPQMFRFGLLKAALQSALEQDSEVTDEASAMELAGHNVKLIPGDARNIKVTTEDDLQLVRLMIESQS